MSRDRMNDRPCRLGITRCLARLSAVAVVASLFAGSADADRLASPAAAPSAGPSVNQEEGNPTDAGPQNAKREYLIKAAILYNFAKFTRWPEQSFEAVDAPLRLCVLGMDPFGEALSTIEGKRVGARNLRTRRISDVTGIAGCHLLFVSTSEDERLAAVLAATDGAAILTVAEMPGFSHSGGIITLNVVDDRNRFDVNRRAAERAGLRLSAKLLRLADSVIQD